MLTAALALVCLVWVYRVGETGAKAVWEFRVHAGGGRLGGGGAAGPPRG